LCDHAGIVVFLLVRQSTILLENGIMGTSISRRIFLKLSYLVVSLAGTLAGTIGCGKRAAPVNCKKPVSSGKLVHLPDTVGPVLFGMPLVLCGATVNGKPNFNTLGNFGLLSLGQPRPVVYVSSRKNHYTNIGIREHKEFSVCFPNAAIMTQTDYCGVYSGHNIDKSGVFNVQYGSLAHAPLIQDCNICFACKTVRQIEVNDMEVFVGEIVEKFANPEFVDNGKVDQERIKPMTFGPGNTYRIGDSIIGNPWMEYKQYS
jgi:flavin reductase (DIM6/NTAB) family NADH-FMN oxidoreductase RutF